MGYWPAVYPAVRGMDDPAFTNLYIARDFQFGHDWTADKAYARWLGWPRAVAPVGWEFEEHVEYPFQAAVPNLAVALVQHYSYIEAGVHHDGSILIGGAAMGADFTSFVFRDENVWPLDDFRLGSGHDLWFEGVTDFWNIADIDLKITLAAAYA
jgi:hypothetical protein